VGSGGGINKEKAGGIVSVLGGVFLEGGGVTVGGAGIGLCGTH